MSNYLLQQSFRPYCYLTELCNVCWLQTIVLEYGNFKNLYRTPVGTRYILITPRVVQSIKKLWFCNYNASKLGCSLLRNSEFTVHGSQNMLPWSVGINIGANSKQIGILYHRPKRMCSACHRSPITSPHPDLIPMQAGTDHHIPQPHHGQSASRRVLLGSPSLLSNL